MKIVVPNRINQYGFLYYAIVLSAIIDAVNSSGLLPNTSLLRIVRYFFIVFPVLLCLSLYLKKNNGNRLLGEELKRAEIMIVVLLFLSIAKSFVAKQFTMESIIQLFQIFVPFVYAYLVINSIGEKLIFSLMKLLLGITIFGYCVWIINNLAYRDVGFSISLLGITSPFECGEFAEVASGLAAFFIYYRKKTPICCAIAVLMNLLMAKRILILMMIVLFMITMLDRQDDNISEKKINIATIFFIIFTVLVYLVYQPRNAMFFENLFGIGPEIFSMGRVYRLWYCMERGFASYGLASTSEYLSGLAYNYLGNEFEMDLVRIIYELGYFAVVIIIYTYLKMSKNNKYCFYLVLFCLLNLLMANGIVRYLAYTYRFITIAMITKNSVKLR